MNKMVESVVISSVADLYVQYGRFTRHYDLADNPLTGLTSVVPKRALYYAVVPESDRIMAEALMKRVAGRRKLREVRVFKDEIKHQAFEPTNRMVVFYA